MAQQLDKVALLRTHNSPSSARGGLRRADAANEITDISDPCDPWIDPNHDAAGSMSSAPAPGNEAARLHLKYDAWNRLVQVRNDPPSRVPPLRRAGADGEPNDLVAIYRYDGLNRRVRKLLPDANGTACDFYYNEAWQVLEVRKDPPSSANGGLRRAGANAAPYKQYVWDIRGTCPPKSAAGGRRRIDAPVLRWCDHNPPSSRRTGLRRAGADGDFDPGACEIVYYLNDAQFNTTAIVDANSAKVLERYRYDPASSAWADYAVPSPYGRVTVLNGDPAVDPDHARDANYTEWTADPNGTSDWDNEVLYCGYRHDWETGLRHVRHRMLHSSAGRWVQTDPAGYVDGMGLYEYARSSPLTYIDQDGAQASPTTGPATTQTRTLGPASRPRPTYDTEFAAWRDDSSYMNAPVTLDEMLGGNAKECAATITLPPNLQLALDRAVEMTTQTGRECGGSIAREGKGSYRVWGPIEGGRSNIFTTRSVPLTIPAEVDRTSVGYYHVHPSRHTVFSGGDIEEFLRWNYWFAVMANCDGSVTRAVVGLGGEPDKTATVRNRWSSLAYSGVMVHGDTRGLSEEAEREYENQLELYEDNLLAGEAKKYRFCSYRREAGSGPLNLVTFNDKMASPRVPGR